MVIAGFPGIGDGRDSKNGPPVAVGIVRENETPFGFASRQGASEVSHDRVVVAVADEHDGERTEQLDKEAPRPSFGQVCTAKIGVREHQLMGPVKAPMNVDDAIERPSQRKGGCPEQLGSAGKRGRSGGIEQAVEIGGDNANCARVRVETQQVAVDVGRCGSLAAAIRLEFSRSDFVDPHALVLESAQKSVVRFLIAPVHAGVRGNRVSERSEVRQTGGFGHRDAGAGEDHQPTVAECRAEWFGESDAGARHELMEDNCFMNS